jgi:hypothetical protein
MSRSCKKTPIYGMCADSDKPGKKQSHRAERSTFRRMLKNCADYDNLVLPDQGELSNVYNWPKDGKRYWSREEAEMSGEWYFNLWKKLMRK